MSSAPVNRANAARSDWSARLSFGLQFFSRKADTCQHPRFKMVLKSLLPYIHGHKSIYVSIHMYIHNVLISEAVGGGPVWWRWHPSAVACMCRRRESALEQTPTAISTRPDNHKWVIVVVAVVVLAVVTTHAMCDSFGGSGSSSIVVTTHASGGSSGSCSMWWWWRWLYRVHLDDDMGGCLQAQASIHLSSCEAKAGELARLGRSNTITLRAKRRAMS